MDTKSIQANLDEGQAKKDEILPIITGLNDFLLLPISPAAKDAVTKELATFTFYLARLDTVIDICSHLLQGIQLLADIGYPATPQVEIPADILTELTRRNQAEDAALKTMHAAQIAANLIEATVSDERPTP